MARARTNKLAYGMSGPGSPRQAMGKLLNTMAGIDLVAIPYKGAALVASTQQYATQLMRSDYERYRTIVKELDLKAE